MARSGPWRRCLAAAVLVALLACPGPAESQEASPRRVGEFLGFILMCGCLPYETAHQSAAFYALMVEEQGARYADTAAGYMRQIQNGSYRNTGTVCSGYVCRNDYTIYMGEILAMIDLETEPDVFMDAYERAYGTGGDDSARDGDPPGGGTLPWFCAYGSANPQCD